MDLIMPILDWKEKVMKKLLRYFICRSKFDEDQEA